MHSAPQRTRSVKIRHKLCKKYHPFFATFCDVFCINYAKKIQSDVLRRILHKLCKQYSFFFFFIFHIRNSSKLKMNGYKMMMIIGWIILMERISYDCHYIIQPQHVCKLYDKPIEYLTSLTYIMYIQENEWEAEDR